MATKKFDQDKAFKNIVGVPDEPAAEQAQTKPKTTRTTKPKAEKITVPKPAKENQNNIASSLIKPVEIRSQRTSITLKPSEYEKAIQNAKKLGVSFNEIVNQLIEKFNNDMK